VYTRRQRRLTRRKPTLPGAEQSGLCGAVVAWYGPECWLAFAGAKVIVTALPNGHVVVPLIALRGEHSTICRYRRGPSRHIVCQWFRGGAGAVVKVLG
ncbi:MAG: hypothetical protein V4468_20425, partial [Pseudomonadota bacterium]